MYIENLIPGKGEIKSQVDSEDRRQESWRTTNFLDVGYSSRIRLRRNVYTKSYTRQHGRMPRVQFCTPWDPAVS